MAPPPGTGVELIDMAGDWTIADLHRLDSTLPLPTQSLVPLFPPANDAILQIAGGQLVDFEGQPLYHGTPETPVQQYLNVADGRVLLFRMVNHFKEPGCVSHSEIAAAFGSVAPGEMLGDVLVLDFTQGTCGSTMSQVEVNGRYRMRLLRNVVPADAPAAASEPAAEPTTGPTGR